MNKNNLVHTQAKEIDCTQKETDESFPLFMEAVCETLAGFARFGLRYHCPIFKAFKGGVSKCKEPVTEEVVAFDAETDETKAIIPSAKPNRKKKTSPPAQSK